jgi:hypothetical protein
MSQIKQVMVVDSTLTGSPATRLEGLRPSTASSGGLKPEEKSSCQTWFMRGLLVFIATSVMSSSGEVSVSKEGSSWGITALPDNRNCNSNGCLTT